MTITYHYFSFNQERISSLVSIHDRQCDNDNNFHAYTVNFLEIAHHWDWQQLFVLERCSAYKEFKDSKMTENGTLRPTTVVRAREVSVLQRF